MEHDVFTKAKELKEKYDFLQTYKNKLQHAKGNSLSKITLDYTVGPHNIRGELYFKNMSLMQEAIEKEIKLVTIEIEELQKQFDEL